MTYGIARAATSPELALYRTPGKKSRFYCAIKPPRVIYTARVNQTITAWDDLTSIVFDGGSGTLANVLADMIMYVGTTAGARDIGFVRIRGTDATHFYIEQVSAIKIMDNHYLTVVDDVRLLPRPVRIVSDVIYMDTAIAYTDQHKYPDPTPIMGPDRVLELTGADVSTTFDFSQSYVIDGSSVASKSTTCPTAASVTNSTTNTPTVTFDAAGWHAVYLTVTATNTKVFRGVRWVYVFDADNMPNKVKIGAMAGNVNDGGWSSEIEIYHDADLSDIYEGAKVIIFSVDYWGDTQEDIAIVPGSEKIEMVGWIGSPESVQYNPERGAVKFFVYGAQYWMQKTDAYPAGVTFKISDPTTWEQFKNLTVDKGVWHFAHWRSTLTRILDFFPSGDTRYSPEVSSLAENLWSQLQEMTALQILARPGFNAIGQLFIQVHPNLIPSGSRTFATVMDITPADWIDALNFDRRTLPEVSQTHMSGIAVDAGGNGLSFFAVAPGQDPEHYGIRETIDKVLCVNQGNIVTIASLYHPWRNNEFPSIPIPLKANIRLIDLFPNQKCTIDIDAADNVRGIAYDGGLIPLAVSVNFDDTTGRATRTVEFESETVEGLAVVEIVEGSEDVSTLPDFSLPDLPLLESYLPGELVTTIEGPPKVLAHDKYAAGLIRCDNFNAAANEQEWYQVNGGLTSTQYLAINRIVICPNGAVYVGNTLAGVNTFLARADYPGATFVIVEDYTSIGAKFGASTDARVSTFNCNPLASEEVAYLITVGGTSVKAFVGSGDSFAAGYDGTFTEGIGFSAISYGQGAWLVTNSGKARLFPPDMSAISSTITLATGGDAIGLDRHVRASTTGYTIHWNVATGHLGVGEDNCTTFDDAVAIGEVAGDMYTREDALVCDPGGVVAMAMNTTVPVKSTDGGYSWATIGNLPALVKHWFAYAGGAGVDSRWIAVSDGGYIYYTDDAWISSPKDCRGNLLSISAIPDINAIKVLEF